MDYIKPHMDTLKTVAAAFFGGVIAYLEPVHNAMRILILAFIIDLLCGIVSGIIAKRERFRFKKFIRAAVALLVYLGIISFTYTIGEHQGDAGETLFVAKTITYVFIYFYSANILKNLSVIFPENRPIKFLDYTLGLEFTKRISWLDSFFKYEKDENK